MLISLTSTSPSGSTKKSQRARPEQPARAKAAAASSRTRSAVCVGRSAPAPAAPCRPRCTWPRSRTTRRWRRSRPAARSRRLVAEHRALDLAAAGRGLDDHPRVVAQRQLDRLVELRPGRSTLVMPTLEPSREGFTQSGRPSASQRSPPALLAVRRRNRPGGRRARRRAASGSACPCRSPRRGRRSRRRGRRAARAGPGRCRPRRRRRAGPGRPRRRRAGRRRASARPRSPSLSQRPSRSIVTATTSWPAAAQPARDRGAGAQRDVVLGGAPAGEDRDPHSSASGSARRGAACRRRSSPRRPVPASEPGGGNWSIDPADFAVDFGFFFFDGRLEAGFADRLHRFGAQLADHVRHLRLLFAVGDDDRDRRARLRPRCRRSGDWLITSPAGARAFFFADAGVEAAAADLLHRDAPLAADQDRHLGQLRPGARRPASRSSRWSRSRPAEGSEWITVPLRPSRS